MNRRPVDNLIGKLVAFYTPKHGFRVAQCRAIHVGKRPVMLKALTVSLAGTNSQGKGPWRGPSVRLPVEALMWPNMDYLGVEYRRKMYPLPEFVDCLLPQWSAEWVYRFYGSKTRRSRCDSQSTKPRSGGKRSPMRSAKA